MRYKKKMRSVFCRFCRRAFSIVEDRVFYAIFQLTRVTNDHYGWRPKEKK